MLIFKVGHKQVSCATMINVEGRVGLLKQLGETKLTQPSTKHGSSSSIQPSAPYSPRRATLSSIDSSSPSSR